MEQNYINASVLNVTDENYLNTMSDENSTILNSFTDFNDEMYRNVLNFVFYPIMFLIWILGNISTIILFFVKKQKTASITFILGLAISDLLFLSVRLITHIYNLGHQFFNEDKVSLRNEVLIYNPQRNNFFVTWSFTYRIVFDILPLPLAFVFNIILIIGLRQNAFSNQNWKMKSKQRIEKEARMTRMLLTISVMFILLCGPYNIITLLANNKIIDGVGVPVAVYDALLVLSMLNSVINFLMYGINDPSLRKEYLQLWRCIKGSSENSISRKTVDNPQLQI